MLKKARKQYNLKPKELDLFIGAKTPATKYYLEASFKTNKLFRYLLFLKLKGSNIDILLDQYIKETNIKL
jgi:hypothetical protein